jgi:DNA-binding transcriptional LysR family regulator
MRDTLFSELSAFVAVAERQSFTKAAAQLRMSPGGLSTAIRNLEESLGVRLLNRTTRSVAPTEAGEQVLRRLRPLLDEFSAVVDSVNAFRDRPAGHLRITVPPAVASFMLAPLLAGFHARYPEIVLELAVEIGFTDIVAGRFDAGIRFGSRVARDMIAVRISEDLHYAVVASPDYLARYRRPEAPDDLKAHNCIRTRFASGGFAPWMFAVNGKITEFEVQGTVIANHSEPCIRAAFDGIGLCYTFKDYIAPSISAGRLVPVLEAWMPPPSDGWFLYYPSRRQNPASLQAFIDFLRTNLRKPGSLP